MSTVTYQPSYSTSKGGRFGFRYLAQPQIPNVSPPVPPNQTLDNSQSTPSKNMGSGASMQDPFVGDSDFEFAANKIPAAQSLGYTQGTQSLLNAIPVVGSIARMTGYEAPTDTYGDYGTYDAEGNVFGNEGRSYDPITGAAAQSYAKPSDWYGSWLGIGTPEGAFGPSSSYGKLRAAGESIPSSVLGSYENSIYNVPRQDRVLGYSPAEVAGLNTMNAQARRNADILSGDIFNDADLVDITAKDLGFTDARPMPSAPSSGTYAYGTQTGDVFTTPGSYQTGVINESGQVETPTGTVVQTTDTFGNTVSLLNDPKENKAALSNVRNIATFDSKDDGGGDVWGGSTKDETNLINSELTDDEFWNAFEADPVMKDDDNNSSGGKG